jgi:zinc transport system substrate-binding protein
MLKTLFLIITLLIFTNTTFAAKPKIVTSISPIASVFAIVASDKATISSICCTNRCPHTYAVKPNQLWHLRNTNLVVYIDDSFETFILKAIGVTEGKVLKLSDDSSLITKINGHTQWHLWLNTANLKIIIRHAFKKLSKLDPSNTDFYNTNYNKGYNMIDKLEKEMQRRLSGLPKPILLDDSLAQFFINFKSPDQISIFYDACDKMSPDKLSEIKNEINKTAAKCVFTGKHSQTQKIQELLGKHVKVVELDTEPWNYEGSYEKMLEQKMQHMLKLVANCL